MSRVNNTHYADICVQNKISFDCGHSVGQLSRRDDPALQ